MLKMVIEWKRWMATEIHMDHSSPIRKQCSPLCQVPLGDNETSIKYKSWCVACLTKEFVLLKLLKDGMNLLLKGLDPFNQSRYMIYMTMGGLCQ